MKLSKKALTLSLIGTAILGLGALGMSARAFWGNGDEQGVLAQKIAEKFNLNQDEVQGVMIQYQEEYRAQRQEQMKTRQEERLNTLVSEGKLTEDQKNTLISKQEEMRNNQQEMSDLSKEERDQLREQRREEMDQWMEENGIDHELMMLGMGGRDGKGGFGRGERMNE